jgi:hypothetical protein
MRTSYHTSLTLEEQCQQGIVEFKDFMEIKEVLSLGL